VIKHSDVILAFDTSTIFTLVSSGFKVLVYFPLGFWIICLTCVSPTKQPYLSLRSSFANSCWTPSTQTSSSRL